VARNAGVVGMNPTGAQLDETCYWNGLKFVVQEIYGDIMRYSPFTTTSLTIY
jgi:hypothetical protein